uniref:Uncharacterized protein n=1 Tax=Aegilops tauschii subsp. strangulata TaxID=200361 RepID=A0A453DIL1_AEGTS
MCSWRCHLNLIWSRDTLGLEADVFEKITARDFRTRIDHILSKPFGHRVRKLSLLVGSKLQYEGPSLYHRMDSESSYTRD